MGRARILAVCVGPAAEQRIGAQVEMTGIDKRPLPGSVALGPLGLDGDVQVDRRFHGGPDRAVYAYAQVDAEFWSTALAARRLRAPSEARNLRNRRASPRAGRADR